MLDGCLVSIIVPIYNAEKYIDVCVESIVSQTYGEIEIILVDDCSTDGSLGLCKIWSERDNWIRVFSLEKNSGPSAARNKGMKEARGEYITFIDSDDWIEPVCIEDALGVAKRKNADMVVWNALLEWSDGNKVKGILMPENEKIYIGEEIKYLEKLLLSQEMEKNCLIDSLGIPSCKMFRSIVVKELAFFEDMDLGEDTCFVMQALQKSNIVYYINRIYYHKIMRENSLSYKRYDDYAYRKAIFVSRMYMLCEDEEYDDLKPYWSQLAYINLKRITHYYMHASPSIQIIRSHKKIKEYRINLCIPINWGGVRENDTRKKWLLKNGLYWCYKIYLVLINAGLIKNG